MSVDEITDEVFLTRPDLGALEEYLALEGDRQNEIYCRMLAEQRNCKLFRGIDMLVIDNEDKLKAVLPVPSAVIVDLQRAIDDFMNQWSNAIKNMIAELNRISEEIIEAVQSYMETNENEDEHRD